MSSEPTFQSVIQADSPAPLPEFLSRRRFMIRGSLAFTCLLLAPSMLSGCGSSGTDALIPVGVDFSQLGQSLDGSLLLPGQPGFNEAALPRNMRYATVKPEAIALCASVNDLKRSLAFVTSYNVPFVVRSGGHSYAGFSTTQGLMIDVSGMKSVSYDSGTNQVLLGPGAQNQTVYSSLRPLSRAITHGRCLTVGVAGLVLGGGIGFNMRLHGLTIDQLVETEILLADGTLLRLNTSENPDLFWAVRGAGGGNFGIHTSFTFATYEVDNLIYFKIDWRNNLEAVFQALIGTMQTAPNEFGVKLNLTAVRGAGENLVTLEILGQLRGTAAELQSILAPAYSAAAPTSEDIQELPYWDAQSLLSVEASSGFSYERSHCATEPLSNQAIATIIDYLQHWPGLDGSADWKIFLCGGAVANIASNATAYVHRQVFGISSVELEWDAGVPLAELEPNLDWVDAFHEQMQSFTSNRSYQNFIDASQTDYLHAYYGENLPRLVQIKSKYDPLNVFHYPQSIPTSL